MPEPHRDPNMRAPALPYELPRFELDGLVRVRCALRRPGERVQDTGGGE